MKYTCIKQCFYRNRLWSLGETLDSKPGEQVPHHFEAARMVKVEVKMAEAEAKTFSALQKEQEEQDKTFLGAQVKQSLASGLPNEEDEAGAEEPDMLQ